MMSTGQRGYASVQKHKSDMFGYVVFAGTLATFWVYSAGHGDLAMRDVDGCDQPAGNPPAPRGVAH